MPNYTGPVSGMNVPKHYPPGGIDLIVTGITFSPAVPAPGDHVTVQAVVKNIGVLATPGGITPSPPGAGTIDVTFFWPDGAVTWSDNEIGVLQPGSSVTVTTSGGEAGFDYWVAVASGTVTATVNVVNRITETNLGNNSFSKAISVVSPPVITAASPPGGTQTQAYSYTFLASGSTPFTWSLNSGTLPAGLSLSSGGVLSGTPTTVTTYTFTVKVSNGVVPDAISSTITLVISAVGSGPSALSTISNATPASQITYWASGADIYMTDVELNNLIAQGITGLLFTYNSLRGYGGNQSFTSATNPTFNGSDGRTSSEWQYNRDTIGTNIVGRCHARGMKVGMGFHIQDVDGTNGDFLPHNPFDTSWWTTYRSSSLSDGVGIINFIKAARNMNFDYLTWDPEASTLNSGGQLSPYWNFPLNNQNESNTRAAVKARYQELASAMWAADANLKIIIYWPTGQGPNGSYDMDYNHGTPPPYSDSCADQRLDGMFGGIGDNGQVITWDSLFYKPQYIGGPSHTYEGVLQYTVLNCRALLSQTWTYKDRAGPRYKICAFSFPGLNIDTGGDITPASTYEGQELYNNKYSEGGLHGFYSQFWDVSNPTSDDMGNKIHAMKDIGANTAAQDTTAPSMSSITVVRSGGNVNLSLTATHNGLGISYILYEVFSNSVTKVSEGILAHTWVVDTASSPPAHYNSHAQVTSQSVTAASGYFIRVTPYTIGGQRISTVIQV